MVGFLSPNNTLITACLGSCLMTYLSQLGFRSWELSQSSHHIGSLGYTETWGSADLQGPWHTRHTAETHRKLTSYATRACHSARNHRYEGGEQNKPWDSRDGSPSEVRWIWAWRFRRWFCHRMNKQPWFFCISERLKTILLNFMNFPNWVQLQKICYRKRLKNYRFRGYYLKSSFFYYSVWNSFIFQQQSL